MNLEEYKNETRLKKKNADYEAAICEPTGEQFIDIPKKSNRGYEYVDKPFEHDTERFIENETIKIDTGSVRGNTRYKNCESPTSTNTEISGGSRENSLHNGNSESGLCHIKEREEATSMPMRMQMRNGSEYYEGEQCEQREQREQREQPEQCEQREQPDDNGDGRCEYDWGRGIFGGLGRKSRKKSKPVKRPSHKKPVPKTPVSASPPSIPAPALPPIPTPAPAPAPVPTLIKSASPPVSFISTPEPAVPIPSGAPITDYKTVLDIFTLHYNNYKTFLSIIKNIIEKRKLVVYGGLAIDYALKLKNHRGLYDDDRLPDFDVFSDNFYEDSSAMTLEIFNMGYTNIGCITALHVSTRTIKLDLYRLCDITQTPLPLIRLPKLEYNGIIIAHPLYLRISLYFVLSMPFAFERSENIYFRFNKDNTRLALLDQYWPIDVDTATDVVHAPSYNLTQDQEINVKVDKTKYISGLIAYAIYYELSKEKDSLVKITFKDSVLTVPKDIPFTYVTYYDYTKKYKTPAKVEPELDFKKRYRFSDYLPKARIGIIDDTEIEVISIKYTIQCKHDIEHDKNVYMILNIYNTMLYFICYYFLTEEKHIIYLKIVKSLQDMIKINATDERFGFSYDAVGDFNNNFTFQDIYRKKIDEGKIPNDHLPSFYPNTNPEYDKIDIFQLKFVKENINTL